MVVGFITTYAIPLRRGVLDTTFAPVTLVSSNNKTDRHDKTEIFLKVALNTITLNMTPTCRLFKTIKKRSLQYM
jgi:hypothetical protein